MLPADASDFEASKLHQSYEWLCNCNCIMLWWSLQAEPCAGLTQRVSSVAPGAAGAAASTAPAIRAGRTLLASPAFHQSLVEQVRPTFRRTGAPRSPPRGAPVSPRAVLGLALAMAPLRSGPSPQSSSLPADKPAGSSSLDPAPTPALKPLQKMGTLAGGGEQG